MATTSRTISYVMVDIVIDLLQSMLIARPRVSAGSILDISKYRDTRERSISVIGGIAILRYIEYRMNR